MGKRELAQRLLRDGGFLTWVDPRAPGVDVPFRFQDLPVLVLPLGAWREGLESNLNIGVEGLSGTWNFGKLVWECRVPWDAVLALAGFDGRGRTWRGDLPPALKMAEPVDSAPLPEGLKYLIVDGQAIVGEGWFRFELDGKQFSGVVWLEGTSIVSMGGDLQALLRHFPTTVDKKGRATRPKFNASLGYVSGRANYEVRWLDCRFSDLGATRAQFGGNEYFWERSGYGPGYWVWLKEWLHSWRRRFAGRRSLIGSSSG